MEEKEERIMEMIKEEIISQGYIIESDIKTDSSRHIEFSGDGKGYIVNLIKLE